LPYILSLFDAKQFVFVVEDHDTIETAGVSDRQVFDLHRNGIHSGEETGDWAPLSAPQHSIAANTNSIFLIRFLFFASEKFHTGFVFTFFMPNCVKFNPLKRRKRIFKDKENLRDIVRFKIIFLR
jgi:hypothetical protein